MRSASPLSAMALTSVAGDILASVKHLLDIVKYLAAPPRRHVGKLPQRQPLQRRLARRRGADDRSFDAGRGVHRRHPDDRADPQKLEDHRALAGHSLASADRVRLEIESTAVIPDRA